VDDFIAWDELRHELTAVLAGVLYLAAVRLIQRYKGVLDRWLKPSEEVPLPARRDRSPEEDEEAEIDFWFSQLKDDPPAGGH
jgi:hypothetical protein